MWKSCLALFAAGCQLGPGVPCTDDTACSPWGRCGAQGFCLVIEEHGAASLMPDLSDAGAGDAGVPGADDAGEVGADAGDREDGGDVDAGAP